MVHRYSGRPYESILLLLALIPVVPSAIGQDRPLRHGTALPAPPPEAICVLTTDGVDRAWSVVPSKEKLFSKTATSKLAVTYVDSESARWPQAAIDAFQYATAIWESILVSSVPIRIRAGWTDLGHCQSGARLGSAGPLLVWRDFSEAPMSGTYYPDPLADALHGSSMNSRVTEPDITADFNYNCDDPGAAFRWYFGTDGSTPAGSVDFVSVALHEIGHGVGFIGSANVSGGGGSVRLSGYPQAYDRNTEDNAGILLTSDSYPDGSAELGQVLEGGAASVFFGGAGVEATYAGEPAPLYSPASFAMGSSYSHLDETTFNSTEHALMTPYLSTQEASHLPGSITCALLADIGWTINPSACSTSLAVELTQFSALVQDDAVELSWITASESGSASFEVEHGYGTAAFTEAGRVAAAGTSDTPQSYRFRLENLRPGIHQFRLKQLDTSGNSTYSNVVEAIVPISQSHMVEYPFPNPTRSRATLSVAVRTAQIVRVELFDLLGRRVASVFDGPISSSGPSQIAVTTDDLSAGTYLLRATGETFSESMTIAVIR
jgi:hypothetical protein